MPLKLNSTGGGSVTLDTPSTAGTYTVTVPATNQTLGITSGTAVASTGGTSIDFTSIPSWVKRITVMFNGVSLSAAASILVQLGDAGGIENTGYVARSSTLNTTPSISTLDSTAGFPVRLTNATFVMNGVMQICLVSGNVWVSSVTGSLTSAICVVGGGTKTLSNVLTTVRITTDNGTDTFDAGSINIMYEG